jgi:hypothetical protein
MVRGQWFVLHGSWSMIKAIDFYKTIWQGFGGVVRFSKQKERQVPK